MLGGSLYYLLAGIGIALTGVLLLLRRRAALGLYAMVLFASTSGPCGKSVWTGGNWCRAWPCGSSSAS
jgi:glucose dehydrogenase